MRKFTLPGRSEIWAHHGAMATSHPTATQVGLGILQQGGSAIDACIAATAVLNTAEPAMTGIGGDCFAMLAQAGHHPIAINGSGYSPAGATIAQAQAAGLETINTSSPWAVTIPGAVAAWHKLHQDYGKLSWQQVLQPAIDYAKEGIPVHERVAYDWQAHASQLHQDEDTARVFLQTGQAFKTGDMFRQPALAASLEQIAQQGPAAFYRGAIAEDMVNKLNSLGGCHNMADFAAMLEHQQPHYVTPIALDFFDYRLWECPPNGQGIAAQIIVGIMAHFAVADMDLIDYHHLLAEATKLAYQLRDNCLSDPAFMQFTEKDLLAADFLHQLANDIDMQQAKPVAPSLFPQHKDTVYLCCVDNDGLNVSFINSIFNAFGSAITAPRSGILLHSRGASFNLQPDHVNGLAPWKRPLHTIIPAMLYDKEELAGPFGVMGGHYQACGQAHVLNLMTQKGYTPQAALNAPRSFAYEDKLTLENSMPKEVIAGLQAKGHRVEVSTEPMGGGQMIMRQANGLLKAASDPRKDGLALGY